MAGSKDDDSGNRTEKATPKRLKDARRKGDVWKSRDVTSTVVLAAWLWLLTAWDFLGAWLKTGD